MRIIIQVDFCQVDSETMATRGAKEHYIQMTACFYVLLTSPMCPGAAFLSCMISAHYKNVETANTKITSELETLRT